MTTENTHLSQDSSPASPVLQPNRRPSTSSSILNTEVKQEEQAGIGFHVPGRIFGLCLAGTVVAVAHHLMLHFLRGRKVADYSQFWVKNASNAFSTVVQWLWAASLTYSLMQVIWYYTRHSEFTLSDLDKLFSLPSLISTTRLLASRWAIPLLPIIIFAIVIQAMSLIGIFAPNALEVAPTPAMQSSITVPTLNLSSGMIYSMVPGDDCTYATVTQTWQRTMSRAMISDTIFGWSAPTGCGTSCTYAIEYNAPALQCTDLTAAQVWQDATSSPNTSELATLFDAASPFLRGLYNATSNIGSYVAGSSTEAPYVTSSPYTFAVAYQPMDDGFANGTVLGSFCTFYDATYHIVTSFLNNTQSTEISIVSYMDPINNAYVAPSDCRSHGWNIEPPAGLSHAVNYHAICQLFVETLTGTVIAAIINDNGQLEFNTSIVTTNLFTVNETIGAWTFKPTVTNLSQGLSDLLANTTVAFLSSTSSTTDASAVVTSPDVVWAYDATRLWIIYGIGIGFTLIFGGFGMGCLFVNGSPGSNDFSHLLAATRNPQLDFAVKGENGEKVLLRYGKAEESPSSSSSPVTFGVVRKEEPVTPSPTRRMSIID